MGINQIKHPDREKPYVTIVDTGLAVRCQQLLVGVLMGHGEGWTVNLEMVEEAAAALHDEIQHRTF
jgi:hypothetical protein